MHSRSVVGSGSPVARSQMPFASVFTELFTFVAGHRLEKAAPVSEGPRSRDLNSETRGRINGSEGGRKLSN